jgi:hypothetical protein
LFQKNKKRFVAMHTYGVDTWTFDIDEEAYILSNSFSCIPYQVGFDKDNRVITYTTDKTIYIDNPSDIVHIEIKFLNIPENDDFEEPVEGILRLTAKNSNNLFISGKVKVKLFGSIFFNDQTKTKTIIINTTGIIDLPVFINQPTSYQATVEIL